MKNIGKTAKIMFWIAIWAWVCLFWGGFLLLALKAHDTKMVTVWYGLTAFVLGFLSALSVVAKKLNTSLGDLILGHLFIEVPQEMSMIEVNELKDEPPTQ